jgi:hypothetical protein
MQFTRKSHKIRHLETDNKVHTNLAAGRRKAKADHRPLCWSVRRNVDLGIIRPNKSVLVCGHIWRSLSFCEPIQGLLRRVKKEKNGAVFIVDVVFDTFHVAIMASIVDFGIRGHQQEIAALCLDSTSAFHSVLFFFLLVNQP